MNMLLATQCRLLTHDHTVHPESKHQQQQQQHFCVVATEVRDVQSVLNTTAVTAIAADTTTADTAAAAGTTAAVAAATVAAVGDAATDKMKDTALRLAEHCSVHMPELITNPIAARRHWQHCKYSKAVQPIPKHFATQLYEHEQAKSTTISLMRCSSKSSLAWYTVYLNVCNTITNIFNSLLRLQQLSVLHAIAVRHKQGLHKNIMKVSITSMQLHAATLALSRVHCITTSFLHVALLETIDTLHVIRYTVQWLVETDQIMTSLR
eukprot:21111-Heterococcus_DN1.PRE.2